MFIKKNANINEVTPCNKKNQSFVKLIPKL